MTSGWNISDMTEIVSIILIFFTITISLSLFWHLFKGYGLINWPPHERAYKELLIVTACFISWKSIQNHLIKPEEAKLSNKLHLFLEASIWLLIGGIFIRALQS